MSIVTTRKGHKLVPWLFGKEVKIPNDWKISEIQNHAKITTGDKDTQNKVKGGKYPFFVRSKKIARINSYSFEGEAILTAGDGEIGKIVHYINDKFDFHQRVYKISNFDNLLNGRFFYYYFSKHFLNRALSMSAKNTVDSVRMEMITKMIIPIPPLSEQEKIATILSNVDSLIESTSKVIKNSKLLKKGLMEKLLTRGVNHTKFKKVSWLLGKEVEIPKEWEKIKLSQCTVSITKGTSPNWQGFQYQKKGVLFITSENVGINKIILKNKKYLHENFNKSQKRSILQKGDILTNIVGASIGRSAIFEINEIANINQAVALIRLNNNKILSKYLVNYLNLSTFINFLIHGTGETARPNLSLQDVKNFPIILPPLSEQQKIASILSNMDTQITSQEQYKEKLEKLKKGLMQKLLTGEVRVKV
jgi:type I restriction enzyme, S subunit